MLVNVVTGEHWTGLPNKSIDQIGKKCPKIVFRPLRTIVGHFSDILSTFPFSGLSNDLPVAMLMAVDGGQWLLFSHL